MQCGLGVAEVRARVVRAKVRRAARLGRTGTSVQKLRIIHWRAKGCCVGGLGLADYSPNILYEWKASPSFQTLWPIDLHRV